jgi:hypothetical protein
MGNLGNWIIEQLPNYPYTQLLNYFLSTGKDALI